jgi:hypothetical protein
LLLYLLLISTAALIVSISHGVMVVRGRRYHRSLRGGTVWASLVVVSAVDRCIRNWQEVVLLDIFFVRLEGDKVVGLGSQLLMDRVQ